ncbi:MULTISPECIES: hypothetical protein [unclassified Burkholderia]|uniref:hypothetical protein n=1 Tax=unclassified Burkholderia TaxID=2613784 RepID=UPI00141D77FD|nr:MULTISPECIES: hypothetical protein [unclassified Burkholderia]NIE61507.1 hypothetical protein [Burkholderia sp. Ap-955]NIF13869.1 hypothetical protein [Burkholderia sp. Ax-1735]NIG06976.1 hypothetical protein [Burkholderia sp. Tr-849]
MKRMLLAAFMLASTLGVGHAQTQTFHFGEGQTGMPGGSPQSASPTARPAPTRRHVTPPPSHHRRAVQTRRQPRHAKPARSDIYTHA